MPVIQSKTHGEECEIGGQYCCLYHQKNKIKIKQGSTFPACNYNGLNCEGTWHLLKEIKEKTKEEVFTANNRRELAYKHHGRRKKSNDPVINKWDLWGWEAF